MKMDTQPTPPFQLSDQFIPIEFMADHQPPVAFMIAATVAPSMYAGGGASRERSWRVRPRPNRFYVNQNFCFVSAPGPILLRLRICQSAK